MEGSLATRQDFSPSCPKGGTWWSCGYGTFFVGCCARDPCDVTCAQGNLRPGGFDPNEYGTFPDATCGTGALFYTCIADGGTFWGCCKSNACAQGGCPDGDLEPARMNQPDQLSRYHATGGSTAPTSVSSTSTTSASAVSTTTTSITSVPSPSASAQAEHKTPVAAIAGGAAGGAFALAAIIGLVIYYMCFVKKSRKGHADTLERRQSLSATGMTETAMKSSDAPPSYSSPNPNINTFYNPLSQHPHPQDSDPRYVTYAHHDPNYPNQHPHNWQPPPQELPVINAPPFPGSHKSMYGHRRGPSELSGDHPRSELESGSGTSQGGSWKADKRKTMYQPMASPRSPQGMASSPMMSPMIEKHNDTNIGVGSPVSPPAQRHEFDSQGNPGMTESGAGPAVMTQNWMAPRDWEPPTQGRGERLDVRNGEEGDGGAQGLGMLDVPDGVDGVQERLDIQKAERRQSPRPRAYSGAF